MAGPRRRRRLGGARPRGPVDAYAHARRARGGPHQSGPRPRLSCIIRSLTARSCARAPTAARPTLRLLRALPAAGDALQRAHAVLSARQRLALADGHAQLQFGRDAPPAGADVPRVRLKEMEVSKLHAAVYWDAERARWAVVDMGSKHGTFVRPHGAAAAMPPPPPPPLLAGASASSDVDPRGQRLSGPRMSSRPRVLKHLDELSIGSTTFVVHIHDDGLPCEACTSRGGDEIDLFYVPKAAREQETAKKRKMDALEPPPVPQGDAKKSLNMLKRTMLSRHSGGPTPLDRTTDESKTYLDRSARRRALHPSTPDAPGIPARPSVSTPVSRAISPPAPEPVSAPPAPLASTNIGHRLLMKQGWTPGTTLGQDSADPESGSSALVEPIQVTVRTARTGLGVPEQPSGQSAAGLSWKEEGKRRRWADMQSG